MGPSGPVPKAFLCVEVMSSGVRTMEAVAISSSFGSKFTLMQPVGQVSHLKPQLDTYTIPVMSSKLLLRVSPCVRLGIA